MVSERANGQGVQEGAGRCIERPMGWLRRTPLKKEAVHGSTGRKENSNR